MSNFFSAKDLDTDVIKRNTCGKCKKNPATGFNYFCKDCMLEMQIILHTDHKGNYRRIWIDWLEDL